MRWNKLKQTFADAIQKKNSIKNFANFIGKHQCWRTPPVAAHFNLHINYMAASLNKMHSMEVSSSPNSPPLIVIVFWCKTNRSSLSQMFFKIGFLINSANFIGKHQCWSIFSCSQVFFKVGVLKNFTIFTEKHLCRSLFLIKLQAFNFSKKQLLRRCFPVNIAKFLRTALFTEHPWWLLLNKFRRSLWFIVWRSDALVI